MSWLSERVFEIIAVQQSVWVFVSNEVSHALRHRLSGKGRCEDAEGFEQKA